ncbi:hypothetical protein IH970_05505 [candidate division KSB1 bacterium]|nr:hypothetical protein [candidate division KSB1 bacterium]
METPGDTLLNPEWLTALGTVALAAMTFLGCARCYFSRQNSGLAITTETRNFLHEI